jgi:hypothetical protein
MLCLTPGRLGNGEMLFGRLADRIRKRRGFARLPVHVDTGDLARSGDFAGFGVAHLVPETDRLVADLEQDAFDLDDIAASNSRW